MASFNHSPVLFIKDDGCSIEFYSHYSGEDKTVIKAMIEHGGGIFHPEKAQTAVCLVEPGDDTVKDARQDSISMQFIWDCVERNTLLDMNSYIMNTQKPFRKEEDATIVKFVLKHAEYPRMTLDQFYQSLSEKGILNRDSYSIKSRAKRIYYQIETYNISESDEKKFKSVIKPALMYGSYCENDDYVILNFLKSRISRVHEKEMYDEMEKKKIVNYSSESLFFRSVKLILPNIDLYDVAPEFKFSIKAHLSQIFSIHSGSTLNDYVIIHFIQGNIKHMRNITLYKKMEEKKILNHSAQYMQLRFLYHILPNIDSYNIPLYFKKRFKNAGFDGFSIFYDESSMMLQRKKYTKDEDYILIHYLQEQKAKPNSLTVYREIEKSQILNRTANSLQHRFRNVVVPNIDSYDISHSLKMHFKKVCNSKYAQSKSNKQGIESNSNDNSYSPSDSEVSISSSTDTTLKPVGKVSDIVEDARENDSVCERTCNWEPVATRSSSKCIERISSRSSKSNCPKSPSVSKKRRKCLPLPDSDSDSLTSECFDTISRVNDGGRELSNKNKRHSNDESQKTVTCEATKTAYAGDLFSYFLSQKSLPDDADVSTLLSQNSLVPSPAHRITEPSPVDSPCFLRAVLDRFQSPRDDELSSDMEVSSCTSVEEHFPVEVKMKFMSRAIALLQNIEHNDLFQECVQDSLFYQKLVFKMYRLNSTVYKNFVEKEVHNIMKKDHLNLTDKVFLIKYLSCLEKISPENPLEVFCRFKLR